MDWVSFHVILQDSIRSISAALFAWISSYVAVACHYKEIAGLLRILAIVLLVQSLLCPVIFGVREVYDFVSSTGDKVDKIFVWR